MCDSTSPPLRAQVRNISDGQLDLNNPKHWYCGRNPQFRRPGQPDLSNPHRITRQRNRQEVIALYRRHLWLQIEESLPIRRWLRELPRDAILYCHCAPKACHCEVILRASLWMKEVYTDDSYLLNP